MTGTPQQPEVTVTVAGGPPPDRGDALDAAGGTAERLMDEAARERASGALTRASDLDEQARRHVDGVVRLIAGAGGADRWEAVAAAGRTAERLRERAVRERAAGALTRASDLDAQGRDCLAAAERLMDGTARRDGERQSPRPSARRPTDRGWER